MRIRRVQVPEKKGRQFHSPDPPEHKLVGLASLNMKLHTECEAEV